MEVVELTEEEKSLVEKIFSEIAKATEGESTTVEEILTPERKRQIIAKVLRRRRHPRRAFTLRDYIENDLLYVLVEDTVSEEEKAALKNACESFAKRINLQRVNLLFLDAPSELEFELDFSYPDDSRLPKSLFDKNVLLISKSEPCLSWFERTCIIPRGEEDKLVPILEQAEILFPDEAAEPSAFFLPLFPDDGISSPVSGSSMPRYFLLGLDCLSSGS